LATELGKSVEEIMQMSSVEVRGWASYYEYVASEQKRAQNKPRGRR